MVILFLRDTSDAQHLPKNRAKYTRYRLVKTTIDRLNAIEYIDWMIPHTLHTIEVPIASLREDEYNARKHGKKNIQAIIDSLREYGQVLPLLVRAEDNTVIGGNGRIEAMRMLQWETCVVAPLKIDALKARALSISLNQTGISSAWDWTALAENLAQLSNEYGVDNIVTGFSTKEIDKLCAAYAVPDTSAHATADLDKLLGDMAQAQAPAQPSDPAQVPDNTHGQLHTVAVYCATQSEAQTVLGVLKAQGLRAEILQ